LKSNAAQDGPLSLLVLSMIGASLFACCGLLSFALSGDTEMTTAVTNAQAFINGPATIDPDALMHIDALIAECERLDKENIDLTRTLRLKARRKDEFDPSMEILKL